MAWLAVEESGLEYIFNDKPIRYEHWWFQKPIVNGPRIVLSTMMALPKGTIKKLIGKELTWYDNPIKIE